MTGNPKKYGFPAKRLGWGWGLPQAWQGWTVLLGYLAIVLFASRLFLDRGTGFYGVLGIATLLLIPVCMLKGEPPGSRRGK